MYAHTQSVQGGDALYKRTRGNLLSMLFLKLIFYWPTVLLIRLVALIYHKVRYRRWEKFAEELCQEDDEVELEVLNHADELPEMCQIFSVDKQTVIGVQFVTMCPDETAHIRIIGETSFSPLYKRKVRYENNYDKDRYIQVNGEKYYLDAKKTRPVDPIKK